jgi:tetratricopeptide (TPR) repeat protein
VAVGVRAFIAVDQFGGPGAIMAKILIVFLFCATPLFGSQAQLKEGNRQFTNGHYDKALKSYEDALIDTPYSPILKYNAGAAAYQAGDFSKATTFFREANENAPPPLRQAAHYNRGNALYKEGRLEDAIEAYKDALRINPADEDARYNLSAALRAKQNPPPQSSKGGGQQKDDKKDSKGKGDPKGDGGEQDQKDQAPKPGQMSKEDAERLLSAAAANEMKKGNPKAGKGEKVNVEEDW